jgi:transposase-like protein
MYHRNNITQKDVNKMRELREKEIPISMIAKRFGICPESVFQYTTRKRALTKKDLPGDYEYVLEITKDYYRGDGRNFSVLADELGVNKNTLMNWLNMTNKPPVEIIEKMYKIVGITPEMIEARKKGLEKRTNI